MRLKREDRDYMASMCIARVLSIVAGLIFACSVQVIRSQDSIAATFRKDLIKVNFIPVIPALSGQSQQWVGIEYQRYINPRLSTSALVNFGIFEDYTFKKYYDYFNQHGGFSYVQKDVMTKGYHIIPSVKYYYILIKKRPGQGLYVGGKADFNQYFKKVESYNSKTAHSNQKSYTINRLGLGACAGLQYTFFTRLTVDVDLSFFIRIFEHYTIDAEVKTPPINAFWKTDEDSMWATVQLMVGYAFGGGKKRNLK